MGNVHLSPEAEAIDLAVTQKLDCTSLDAFQC
jgi:hypothetical protein